MPTDIKNDILNPIILIDGSIGVAIGLIPPIASISPSVVTIALPNDTITLDGSGSTDSDGVIVSYLWTQTSGVAAAIVSPTASSTVVSNLAQGNNTFSLLVTDNDGLTSTSNVSVTVIAGNIYEIAMGDCFSIESALSWSTVYSNNSTIAIGTVLFTDVLLTIPYVGNTIDRFRIRNGSGMIGNAYRVDSNGLIYNLVIC